MKKSKSKPFQFSLLSLSLQKVWGHLTRNTCFTENRIINPVIQNKHVGVALGNSSHATYFIRYTVWHSTILLSRIYLLLSTVLTLFLLTVFPTLVLSKHQDVFKTQNWSQSLFYLKFFWNPPLFSASIPNTLECTEGISGVWLPMCSLTSQVLLTHLQFQ